MDIFLDKYIYYEKINKVLFNGEIHQWDIFIILKQVLSLFVNILFTLSYKFILNLICYQKGRLFSCWTE